MGLRCTVGLKRNVMFKFQVVIKFDTAKVILAITTAVVLASVTEGRSG